MRLAHDRSLSYDQLVSVTLRALSILDTFDWGHRRLKLSDIARRANLPMATAHRHVQELVGWQALERREDGSYQIGERLWRLGLLSAMHVELREAALPFLQELCAQTGDAVQMAVRDGLRALCVERLAGLRSVPVVSRPGGTLPLHASSVGKLLLAWAPEETQREALANLDRHTARTVVEPARLGAELAEIRRTGVAVAREELVVGASSMAVAVTAPDGTVVAAVGLVAPSRRPNLASRLPALRATVAAVSARLRLRDAMSTS